MSVSSRIFKAAALFSAAAIAIVSTGCSGDPVKQEIVTSITDQVQFSYETAKAQYMTIEENHAMLFRFPMSTSAYIPSSRAFRLETVS